MSELRQIRRDADYLAAVIDATAGDVGPKDLDRLRKLTETLQDIKKPK